MNDESHEAKGIGLSTPPVGELKKLIEQWRNSSACTYEDDMVCSTLESCARELEELLK